MAKKDETNVLSRRLVSGLQIVLVGLIAYMLVRAVIIFITPQSAWTSPKFSTQSLARQTAAASTSYDFSLDPFHRDAPDVAVEDLGGDAPETTLNLKLFGYISGPNGRATLRTPDNKQRGYGVGDEVISNVYLKAVNNGYVVLSQNGKLERLTFERDDKSTLTTPVIAAASNVTSLNSTDLFKSISLKPVMKNGKSQGMKIASRNPSIDLKDFGLRNGDIIIRVGSTDLTKGTPNPAALLAQIKGANSMKITLIRDGKTKTVKVGRP